ncbi:MAG TPA: cobalamin-binding protein [bacterium]|nr:cobalamin-binding protein [bacterium]
MRPPVVLEVPDLRIVSLLPSATEIVCALGLTNALVGISHDCDYPPAVSGKPMLSQAIITGDLSSGEVDRRIREQLHQGLSVYHLDQVQLAQLVPTLILTQELCEVCAPSFSLVKAVARIAASDSRIVSLEPHGLDDILETIRLVGDLTGAAEHSLALVATLRAHIERVRGAVAGRLRPTVICLEWLDPLFVAGHWVPEMVDLAGGSDVLGRPRAHSYTIDWPAVLEADPDVLVLMPCGFDLRRTRDEASGLMDRTGWRELRAVRSGRVYVTNGTAYFNRPGPRIVDGLEILGAILHPEAVSWALPENGFESL